MSGTAILPLTDKMHDALMAGRPVILLPPGFAVDALLSLLLDVVLKGSADRLLIMPTEQPFTLDPQVPA